jgi:hypothetical protein
VNWPEWQFRYVLGGLGYRDFRVSVFALLVLKTGFRVWVLDFDILGLPHFEQGWVLGGFDFWASGCHGGRLAQVIRQIKC